MINRDKLMMGSAADTAEATMAAISGVQTRRPECQVGGLAAAFLLLCDHHEVNPNDALTVASNMLNHEEGRSPEFRAARAYVENEL